MLLVANLICQGMTEHGSTDRPFQNKSLFASLEKINFSESNGKVVSETHLWRVSYNAFKTR
jgi:hypothetical protein